MKNKPRTPYARQQPQRTPLQDRQPIPWPQLCALVRTAITDDPSCAEWKGRIMDRLIAGGWQTPHHGQINRAMDRCMHLLPPPFPRPKPKGAPLPEPPDPTKIPRPLQGTTLTPEGWTTPGQHLTRGNHCGNCRHVSGRAPLRCTLPAGHPGDHGLHMGMQLLVRWARSADDGSAPERHA